MGYWEETKTEYKALEQLSFKWEKDRTVARGVQDPKESPFFILNTF